MLYDEILPNALAMGVKYETFWTLNPKTFKPFVKAFNLKKKQENASAWLQGVYIKQAISSVMSRDAKYPTEPHEVGVDIDKESLEERKYKNMKDAILRDVEVINQRFRKES